ncbi:Glycosyl transferases group 1 [Xylanibacter ruminicola]|uniref:Glycosyl transferases group 1 n=2 Tax=Xylanibacter ruminicola TaxID=839 RepID=A0A1H4DKA6_XYLRU|nr:Glycosyl transferases group 1 [Xylanibacter ruminicola]
MHYMEIGGAEISLIGLLQAIDYSLYDVDLFIHSHQGELMQFIPKEVNLLPEIKSYSYIERPLTDALRNGEWKIVYGRLMAKWQFVGYLKRKNPKDGSAALQYVARNIEPYLTSLYDYGEYDLAVSFLHPHNYVLSKVKAKKKICWIHTDYSTIDVDTELELPIWLGYDHIMSISSEASKAFLKVFPSLSSKVMIMENILSPRFVLGRSELMLQSEVEKEMPREDNLVRLLSVGRFSEAKNYDNVPDICKRVNALLFDLNTSLSVKWYIIGYGDESLIHQKIAESGMEKNVIILGKRSNPYPYIKACDIYVQPSRYEGKSVTVREAQMLGKPVAVTNYATAASQIKDGVDGCIVPMDNEGCARGLAEFILDKELQNDIVDYLQTHDYGNESEIEKLYKLIP